MEFVRDESKNNSIKNRPGANGIGFEDVEYAIRNWDVLWSHENDNPSYKGQEVLIVSINNYPHKVPYNMIDDNTMQFITVYPYRKFKF